MITRTILIKKAFKNLKAQFNYFFVDLKYILNAKSAKFFFEIIENIFKVREGVKLSKDFFVIIF